MNRKVAICFITGSFIWTLLAIFDTFLLYYRNMRYENMDIVGFVLYRTGWTLIPICFLIASILLLKNNLK